MRMIYNTLQKSQSRQKIQKQTIFSGHTKLIKVEAPQILIE